MLGRYFIRFCHFQSAGKQRYQFFINTDFQYLSFLRKKGIAHNRINRRTFKTNVIFRPSGLPQWIISMPLSGKQHHQPTFTNLSFRSRIGRKQTAPFCNIDQLIFPQYSSFFGIEIVTGRMLLQRIRRIGRDRLIANRIHPQTEFAVHVINYQVFKF